MLHDVLGSSGCYYQRGNQNILHLLRATVIIHKMKKINSLIITILISISIQTNAVSAQNCRYKIKYAYRCDTKNTNIRALHYIFVYDSNRLHSIFKYDYKINQLKEIIIYEYEDDLRIGKIHIDEKGNIIDSKKTVFDSLSNKYVTIPRLDIDISRCSSSEYNGSMNMECKWDNCGNVIEEIEYSPINKKRILSKYIYKYIYW